MTTEAEVYEALKHRVEVDRFGTRRYLDHDGQLHRDDGPAIVYTTGGKIWYCNGQCHREDGPAIEWGDGGKEWYQNGLRHRTDGPAVTRPNGACEWWINGTEYNERDYYQQLKT